jgi:ion channel-forming bestrophin family protein
MIEYDPHDWRSHLFDIKGSMLREIRIRVLVPFLWAAAVTGAYEWWQWNVKLTDRHAMFPTTMHLLIGTALGLLLVFRTNSSYDRFWEGRRMWGNIINESRNLARLGSVSLAGLPELRLRLFAWLTVFPVAAMHQLRGTVKELGAACDQVPPIEMSLALGQQNVALAAARQMTGCLAEAHQRGAISEYVFVALDQNVQLLVDYLGACERIHRTPMPFAYMVHVRRVLLIYCYSLPLALVRDFNWWTIPATLFVAFVLLGIEEIGVEIEDPFGTDDNDLPLESFCETIRRNVEEMGGRQ